MSNHAMRPISLEHKTLDMVAYDNLYRQCRQSSILQSAAYGEAKRLIEGFEVERKVIMESDNTIALYQVLMKRLPIIGKVARINRGPLYMRSGPSSLDDLKRLYRSLYEEWVIRRGFFLQIAPNVTDDIMSSGDFKELGFIRSDEPNWHSGWLCLNQSEEALRKALQQKWRNLLNKSEKMETELHHVESEKDLEAILVEYDRFMRERNFQSTSSHLIRAMYRQSSDTLYATMAKKEGRYLGAIIIAKHGDSCTYLVGVTSDEGRKANANYLLLWNGLLHCRDAGFQWFDVGGIDEINTPGIAHFKKGLGFIPYRLIGEFEGHRGFRYQLLSRLKRYYYRRGLKKKDAHAAREEVHSEGR